MHLLRDSLTRVSNEANSGTLCSGNSAFGSIQLLAGSITARGLVQPVEGHPTCNLDCALGTHSLRPGFIGIRGRSALRPRHPEHTEVPGKMCLSGSGRRSRLLDVHNLIASDNSTATQGQYLGHHLERGAETGNLGEHALRSQDHPSCFHIVL